MEYETQWGQRTVMGTLLLYFFSTRYNNNIIPWKSSNRMMSIHDDMNIIPKLNRKTTCSYWITVLYCSSWISRVVKHYKREFRVITAVRMPCTLRSPGNEWKFLLHLLQWQHQTYGKHSGLYLPCWGDIVLKSHAPNIMPLYFVWHNYIGGLMSGTLCLYKSSLWTAGVFTAEEDWI